MKPFDAAIRDLDVDEVRRQLEGARIPPQDGHWRVLNEACMVAAKDRGLFDSYLLVLRVFAEKTHDYHSDATAVLWREVRNAEKPADDLWRGGSANNQTFPDQRQEMIAILRNAPQGIHIRPGTWIPARTGAMGAQL